MAEVYNFKQFVNNSQIDQRNREALEREQRIKAASQDSMFLTSPVSYTHLTLPTICSV